MKRENNGKPGFLPQLTLWKMIRLAIFAILTAIGFILSHNGYINSFGWGYAFGLIGMAILIG